MKSLAGEITDILGPGKWNTPEGRAIIKLAESIEELKAKQNSIDRRTSGLKLYGKKL